MITKRWALRLALPSLVLSLSSCLNRPEPPETEISQQALKWFNEECTEFGYATTLAGEEFTSACKPRPSDDAGLAIRATIWFNCRRAVDNIVVGRGLRWTQCLNGAEHESHGNPERVGTASCFNVNGLCPPLVDLIDTPVGVGADTFEGMLLRSVIGRIAAVREQVLEQGGPDLDDRLRLITASELFAEVADQSFMDKAAPHALVAVNVATRLLDLATDFTPGVSLLKDATIIVTGFNPVTGESVSDAERAMVTAGLLVPSFFAGGAKALVKTAKHLESVAELAKPVSHIADDLVQVLRRADEALAEQLLPCAKVVRNRATGNSDRNLSQPGQDGPDGTRSALTIELHGPTVLAGCSRALGQVTAEVAERAQRNLDFLKKRNVGFGDDPRLDYDKKFRQHYAQYDSGIGQVHHAVEQQAMDSYPNLGITPNQMHSLENLRGIPRGRAGMELHQSKIRVDWNEFYKHYDSMGIQPTLDDVLRFAKVIDDRYGHVFVPPIR